MTNDPRTPNFFESTVFRNIILSFADEGSLSLDAGKSESAVDKKSPGKIDWSKLRKPRR